MFYVISIVFLFIIRCRSPSSKSLSDIIRLRYGNHVLKIVRKFEKLDYRVRKIICDISFLQTCKDNDLCPTFLRYKMSSKRLQNSEAYKQSQQLFLQEEISFKALEKEKVTNDLKKLESDLKSVINFIHRNHIYNKLINGNIKTTQKK